MTAVPRLDPDAVLDNIRPLVLVVERSGIVSDAYGAADRVARWRTEDLVGRQVLDLVSEADHLALMHTFLPGSEQPIVHNPSPFPVWVIGPRGERELVDLFPRGLEDGSGWVITVVPRREFPTPVKMLDLMMDGASIETLLRELVTHQSNSVQEVRIDAHIVLRPERQDHTTVSTERNAVSDALQTLVDSQNDRLWRNVAEESTTELSVEQLPAVLRIAAEHEGFDACIVTRIDIDGHLEAAMVSLITDPKQNAMSGNVSINQRELIRIVRRIVRRDVAERVLRAAALEDSLTGLSNRGSFDRSLSAFSGTDATLLFIDLDHFKAVNDQFGHSAGDQVLIEVANRLRNACRPADVIARIGGDEFAVLLTDTDERTARAISERLLQAIAAPLPPHLGPSCISASVGYARQHSPTNPADLLHAADRAMLSGKRSGRARIVVGG